MDQQGFDRLVRVLSTGLSRRSVLRRATMTTATSPLTLLGISAAQAQGKSRGKDKNKDKEPGRGQGNQGQAVGAGDRDIGHPCAGNQQCRTGLYCWPTGPGSVPRCTDQPPPAAIETDQAAVPVTNDVCAGDCSQPAIAGAMEGLKRPPRYWIDVACQFDAPRHETYCICTGQGEAGAPPIRTITLPTADICAVVITEQMRPGELAASETMTATEGGEANAGSGGVASADASGGAVSVGDVRGENDIAIDASGGTASADASGGDTNVAVAGGGPSSSTETAQGVGLGVLELTLEGNVVPGRLTTYWVDTEQGRRPAPGPALVQVAEESVESGAIVAEARACVVPGAEPGYDWFGQCTSPATGMAFTLYPQDGDTPLATLDVNAQGRARFGDLPPGVYRLKPEGQIWCYAESDQVDAKGNILVEAGLESHVWSFVCGAPGGS